MLNLIFSLLIYGAAFASVIEAPVNPIDFEQNPPSIVWKKIDTENFEIIFPQEVEEQAQRVAHLLETAYPFVTKSMEVAPPKISLVLQNQSMISNGFVTLAPRRTEWYITPSIDPELTNTEWLKTLAIHEFRHVVQFQKSRYGFSNVLYFLLGEIGQAIGVGLSMPPWFLEGDAVGTETALTEGGRGRLPLFERDLRTLLLSGQDYDYDKTHLGSYKNYIPNHYVYGYFYTTFMRNQYGEGFLPKLVQRAADMSYWPLAFYTQSDRLFEKKFEKFYAETMADLVKTWKAKLDELKPTPFEVQNLGERKGWTNYFYPQTTSDGKIFALKKGLSHIDQFVVIDGKKEKTVYYPGPFGQVYPMKLRGEKVAFLEIQLDPRWGYRDYTRLKVYDLKKDKIILDMPGEKWRLATLDQSGSKIALIRWEDDQKQSVDVVDLESGLSMSQLYYSDRIITSMDWINVGEGINEGSLVMVVKDRNDLKSLVKLKYYPEPGEEVLVQPSLTNLGSVAVEEGQILVESPASGIDNIYAYKDGKLVQITSSKYGAYAPELSSGNLIYNDYSPEGMNIVKKDLPWDQEQKSQDSFVPFYEKFAATEDYAGLKSGLLKPQTFEVKNYSQPKSAFNLHSWLIFAPPLSNSIILEGFSRDILNKFSLSVGGSYNLNERTTQGFVSAAWSHLYPVFDLRSSYGTRRQDIRFGGKDVDNKWEEGTFELGAQVPWKKITGRFIHSFSARAFAKIIKVTNKLSNDLSDVNDGALYSPGGELQYSVLSRMAKRDLLPPWGMSLMAHVEEGKDFTGVDQRGAISSVDSRWYLPGFLPHHSFYQQLAYEVQRDKFYQYASYVYKVRGTRNTFLEEFRKYSANYTLPLFYPDWHWSRYFYVKRVFGNLFYDEMQGRYRSYNYGAASTGWEVLLETHFLRIFLPITWGVRGSYVIYGPEKNYNYEIFLSSLLGVF